MIAGMSESDDTPETNADERVAGARHRQRMVTEYRDLIEDLIEDGRRRGLFDDLSGAGRPLDLEQNVFEGSATLANKLLKDNHLRPVWLARRVDVVEKIDALRGDIGRAWARYRAAFDAAQGDAHRPALTIGWDDLCRRWETAIAAINKEIDSYNLKRPASQLEIFKLRLDDELRRADAPRYLR